MTTIVIGYYKTTELLNQAIWEHIKHYQNVSRAISVRFEPYHKFVWHRGHVLYHELKFKAVVTYETLDGKIQTRRCSAQGWSVFGITRENNQLRVHSWDGREFHEYALTRTTCTCRSFQFQTGLVEGKCKHLQVAALALNHSPSLEQPLYYPFEQRQAQPKQAQPETVQLHPGLVLAPGFRLVRTAQGYRVVADLRDRIGREQAKVIGTVEQQGEWVSYSNPRGTFGKRVTATAANLWVMCQELHQRSMYSDWQVIDPNAKDEDKVDLNELASAVIDWTHIKSSPNRATPQPATPQPAPGKSGDDEVDLQELASAAINWSRIKPVANSAPKQPATMQTAPTQPASGQPTSGRSTLAGKQPAPTQPATLQPTPARSPLAKQPVHSMPKQPQTQTIRVEKNEDTGLYWFRDTNTNKLCGDGYPKDLVNYRAQQFILMGCVVETFDPTKGKWYVYKNQKWVPASSTQPALVLA